MKITICITIFLLYCMPGISTAEGTTGTELLNQCKDAVNFMDNRGPTNFKVGQCLGYLNGLTEATNYNRKDNIRNVPYFCLPNDVTIGQEVMIVVKYLENNPEKLHEPSFSLVMKALKDAFPCKKK